MIRRLAPLWIALACAAAVAADEPTAKNDCLPGTRPLTVEGDVASLLVERVDRFLLDQIAQSVAGRAQYWHRDFSSPEAYNKSIEPNRRRLAHILGVRDERVPFDAPELMATTEQPALVGQGENYKVYAVRWPVLAFPGPSWPQAVSIHGEGLLLVPDGEAVADIVALPDADQTPEQIVGLADGVAPESQFARRLAESGCRVLVPTLISRHMEKRNGRANLTNREYLYRSAFELGRHLIGYEVQKVLAGVDWFTREAGDKDARIGVIGYGEGGMIALYAAALDTRIDAVVVSGYIGPRKIWEEPIDRNVFGRLREFGDAELLNMLKPRGYVLEMADFPEITLPGEGGAPARLTTPERSEIQKVITDSVLDNMPSEMEHGFVAVPKSRERSSGPRPFGDDATLEKFIKLLGHEGLAPSQAAPRPLGKLIDPSARQQRQVDEIDRHNQWLLRESPYVRKEFMKNLDTRSLDAYRKTVEPYREIFREQVVGRFDIEPLPFHARSRKSWETDKWVGYEVMLNLWPIHATPRGEAANASAPPQTEGGLSLSPPLDKGGPGGVTSASQLSEAQPPPPNPPLSRGGTGEAEGQQGEEPETVFAYGVLILPKDIKEGEKRPVVVCQHGLEGRPTDVFLGNHPAYHDFAAKLAERGFITFAPQNLYIFKDRFRTLQRKANPLGKTLFSVIVPQHQQIVDWLQTQPFVDPERIAFYGLSYGGKSAMRIPPLVTDYCLSICSADFNEWVDKNASTRGPYSYVWTGEYEIFEFDLGSTFNYAEMAALICPRPFMVERGHFDGVGTDENVAHEFAKVRNLYAARLGLGDRCEIEWFVGPHTINGQGTFDFLHRHLNWPKPE